MKFILCLIIVVSSVFVQAQDKNEIDSYIQKQISEQKITGLAVGIVKDGKLLVSKGYGMANIELNVPASDTSVFKLASVSKQMIATAIMKLVQEGKINLTDPVNKYFTDAPATWNNITIRNLLNHTSGLERESPAFDAMEVQPDSLLIKRAYRDNLVFVTGTKWQYCNLGYFMLADIIRRVSGKPFPQYMREEIFVKNGLNKTRTTTVTDLVLGRAGGYINKGGDTVVNAEEYIALRPSGAFISTITDMIKWEMLIQQNKILTKENWQKMWTDVVKEDSTKPTSPSYGYGWEVSSYLDRQAVHHGGSLPGFRTIFFRFPTDNTAIIVLTNSNHANPTAIAKGLADILYKK